MKAQKVSFFLIEAVLEDELTEAFTEFLVENNIDS